MDYLRIHDWEQFQQYKDNRPIHWIKVHHALLENYKYSVLSDSEFGQLMKIWLLASRINNKIPNDPSWIKEKTGMSLKPNIDKYIELGFLEFDGSVRNRTKSYEIVPREEKSREEKSRNIYGQFQNVKLTDNEYQSLIEKFGEEKTKEKIESLSEYVQSKGKRYKDHYATILAWARKAGDYGKSGDNSRRDSPFLRALREKRERDPS